MNKIGEPVKQKVRLPTFIVNHEYLRLSVFPGKKGYRVVARDRQDG